MRTDDLAERLAQELQADPGTVSPETHLEDMPEYDSMARLVVLAMLDGHYGVLVDVDELEACTSVADMAALIERKQAV